MSLTGSGFDSSLRGGSFLGKKNSSSWRESDLHRGSSNISWATSRCSSGSFGGALGLISTDPMIPERLTFASLLNGPELPATLTQMSSSGGKLHALGGRRYKRSYKRGSSSPACRRLRRKV